MPCRGMDPFRQSYISLGVAECAASTRAYRLIDEFLGYGYRERAAASTTLYKFKYDDITVDEERIKLQIWNLYGVRYLGLPPVLFRSPLVGLMLLYDVSEEDSFEKAKKLITVDVQQVNPKTSIVLVGCHYHQKKKEREVAYHTAREFGDERDIPVIEISHGNEEINVELAFVILVVAILSKKM